VAAFAQVLTHTGVLKKIQEQVRFARARFGQYDLPGGVFDRTAEPWLVVDVDGTRQTARQRALPQMESLPAPHRRFDQVCAPGYQGRKRGEVVRTRTVLLQAHTHQFLGTFGGPGNGDYRGELRRAIGVINAYATKLGLPTASVLLRLDGHDARRGSAPRCAGRRSRRDCP
jgi:hypothetical protein